MPLSVSRYPNLGQKIHGKTSHTFSCSLCENNWRFLSQNQKNDLFDLLGKNPEKMISGAIDRSAFINRFIIQISHHGNWVELLSSSSLDTRELFIGIYMFILRDDTEFIARILISCKKPMCYFPFIEKSVLWEKEYSTRFFIEESKAQGPYLSELIFRCAKKTNINVLKLLSNTTTIKQSYTLVSTVKVLWNGEDRNKAIEFLSHLLTSQKISGSDLNGLRLFARGHNHKGLSNYLNSIFIPLPTQSPPLRLPKLTQAQRGAIFHQRLS